MHNCLELLTVEKRGEITFDFVHSLFFGLMPPTAVTLPAILNSPAEGTQYC